MADRKRDVWSGDEEGNEAQCENGVSEAGTEVLPEGRAGAGVVGGEEESQHEDQAAGAGGANEDA